MLETSTDVFASADPHIGREYFFSRPAHLVRRVHHICSLGFERETAALNVTHPQFEVIAAAGVWRGLDQAGLSLALGIDAATIATVVNGLVARNLVVRRTDESDRRRRIAELTPEGEAVRLEVRRRAHQLSVGLLTPLGPAAEDLQEGLGQIILAEDSDAPEWRPPPLGEIRSLGDLLPLPFFRPVGFRIRRCCQIGMAHYARQTRGLDITGGQYATLLMLSILGETDQTGLGRAMGEPRSNLRLWLKGLIDRGCVAVSGSEADRRQTILRITESGRAVVREIRPRAEAGERELLRPLKPEQRRSFIEALQLFVAIHDRTAEPLEFH